MIIDIVYADKQIRRTFVRKDCMNVVCKVAYVPKTSMARIVRGAQLKPHCQRSATRTTWVRACETLNAKLETIKNNVPYSIFKNKNQIPSSPTHYNQP